MVQHAAGCICCCGHGLAPAAPLWRGLERLGCFQVSAVGLFDLFAEGVDFGRAAGLASIGVTPEEGFELGGVAFWALVAGPKCPVVEGLARAAQDGACRAGGFSSRDRQRSAAYRPQATACLGARIEGMPSLLEDGVREWDVPIPESPTEGCRSRAEETGLGALARVHWGSNTRSCCCLVLLSTTLRAS